MIIFGLIGASIIVLGGVSSVHKMVCNRDSDNGTYVFETGSRVLSDYLDQFSFKEFSDDRTFWFSPYVSDQRVPIFYAAAVAETVLVDGELIMRDRAEINPDPFFYTFFQNRDANYHQLNAFFAYMLPQYRGNADTVSVKILMAESRRRIEYHLNNLSESTHALLLVASGCTIMLGSLIWYGWMLCAMFSAAASVRRTYACKGMVCPRRSIARLFIASGPVAYTSAYGGQVRSAVDEFIHQQEQDRQAALRRHYAEQELERFGKDMTEFRSMVEVSTELHDLTEIRRQLDIADDVNQKLPVRREALSSAKRMWEKLTAPPPDYLPTLVRRVESCSRSSIPCSSLIVFDQAMADYRQERESHRPRPKKMIYHLERALDVANGHLITYKLSR